MSALAKVEVKVFEAPEVHPEQKRQQRVEESAGIVGGGEIGRFDGDDDQPQGCGDPSFQNTVPVRTQAGLMLVAGQSSLLAKEARNGAPKFEKTTRRFLLNRIVGSLGGDHHVGYVAFAQAGAADADEARLLQEFGYGGAAAVAHA